MERDYNLDLIKVLAISATILIHLFAPGYSAEVKTNTWYFFIVCGAILRYCVPVFCMASGYIMGDKETNIKDVYKKYLPKFIGALVFAEALYRLISIWYMYRGGVEINLADIGRDLYNGNTKVHLYYLFIIAFVYMVMPVIQVFVENEKGELEYLLKVWIVTSLSLTLVFMYFELPFLVNFKRYVLDGVYNYVMYALTGAYIKKYKDKILEESALKYLIGWILSYGWLVMMPIMTSSGETNIEAWESVNIFIFGLSYSVFCICLKIKIKRESVKKILSFISKNVLGIYLYHVIFLDRLRDRGFMYVNFSGYKQGLVILVEFLEILLISLALTNIFKQIKLIFQKVIIDLLET